MSALPPKGAKRPDPAKIAALEKTSDHHDIKHYLGGASPLPKATNNRAKLVARKNQGQSSACTCHSLSAALATLAAIVGVACVDPSEHVLYSRSGRIEQATGDLQDNGRQLLDVWQAQQNDGLAPQTPATSPDGRNSDIWTAADATSPPPNVNIDATPGELELAGKCRLPFALATIDPTAADCEAQVQASLAAGRMVWFGTEVGQAFESATGSADVAPDSNPNDPDGGGHALFFVDYRTKADGSVEYLVCNSWGLSWGDSTDNEPGLCWVGGAFVRSCWELHALSLMAPPGQPSLFDRAKAAIAALEAAAAEALAFPKEQALAFPKDADTNPHLKPVP